MIMTCGCSCCQEGRLEAHAGEGFNFGREGSVDFHKTPVLHCMSVLAPVVVVVLLARTTFHHLSSCMSFLQTPVLDFASLFTTTKAYLIIADCLKGHKTPTST